MNLDHFISIAPYFTVPDVVKAAAYYRDFLGFHYDRFWGEPPGFVMVKRSGVIIMLKGVEGTDVARPNHRIHPDACWDAYIWVPEARSLYDEFKARGVTITREIEATDYGCLDFDIQDLDGYVLCFGQDLDG